MADNTRTRLPKPQYKGTNGFIAGFTDEVAEKDLSKALDRHRTALYTLKCRGETIPSFQEMESYSDQPENAATVKQRIKELQKEHLDDLQLLYEYHASDYFREITDLYRSKDDTQYCDEGETDRRIVESYGAFDDVYTSFQSVSSFEPMWMQEYSQLRYDYLVRLLELQKRLPVLEAQEAEVKRRREAVFPNSASDFHSKSKDVQLRVARFLVADPMKQEKTLSEFGWAWRQVQPLKDEFLSNIVFATQVEEMVRSEQVTDPRKARMNLS